MHSVWSFWTTAASTVMLGMLLAAVLGAIFLRGPDRDFWTGFALLGWAYLFRANWDWIGGPMGHDLTRGLSDAAEAVVPVERPPTPASQPGASPHGVLPATSNLDYWERVQLRDVRLGHFVPIGRVSLSLIFALVGGIVARAFAARTKAAARAETPPDPRGSR